MEDEAHCKPANKLQMLTLLDAIAILMIVIFHSSPTIPEGVLYIYFHPYLGILGLATFTFSSGFKMIYRHYDQIEQKPFLLRYFKKRFIRLYKPYLGYTILTLPFLILTTWVGQHYLNLTSEGHFTLDSFLTSRAISGFLFLGENPVATQLWYLFALLLITAICIFFIYQIGLRFIFWAILPFFLVIDLVFFPYLPESDIPVILLNTFAFVVMFILGMLMAYLKIEKQESYRIMKSLCGFGFMPALITVLLLGGYSSQMYQFLILGFTFPCFLALLIEGIRIGDSWVISSLTYIGQFSFIIYLFHYPLILPVLNRCFVSFLGLRNELVLVFTAFLTCALCISVYMLVRRLKLNILIE